MRWRHGHAGPACARGAAVTLCALLAACGSQRATSVAVPPGAIMAAAPAPESDYLVFVGAEAVDRISLIRFGADGATIEREHQIGLNRADPDGPHGLGVSPDGRYYYVTTGHGTPNGHLWKLRTEDSGVVGRVELGLFPASLQVSPDGHYVYVVNFNLHGDMEPSSVSIVDAASMIEVARLRTCTMPHGSRTNPQGTLHYSACMMDDVLVEIDTREFAVSRHFMLTRGREHGMSGAPGAHAAHEPAAPSQHAGHDPAAPPAETTQCSPTWAATSHDGSRIYVACNASDDIVEVDAESWTLLRRVPAGAGVYNLAATADGRLLVATNKRGQSVSVFDIASGRELARIATLRPVVHGVALSDDSRYAFISVEGRGSEPGTVEMIDLRSLTRAASVDVGQMAGGIDVWQTVPRGARERTGTAPAGPVRAPTFAAALAAGRASLTFFYVPSSGFAYRNAAGTLTGVTVELLRGFARYVEDTHRIPVQVTWVEEERWSDFYGYVRDSRGGAFGIGNVTITQARGAELDFSPPYLHNIAVLVTHEGVAELNSIDAIGTAFAGLTALRYPGTLHEARLERIRDEHFPAMRFQPVASNDELVATLAAGPATFGYIDIYNYWRAREAGRPLRRHPAGDDAAETFGVILPNDSDWTPVIAAYFREIGGAGGPRMTALLREHLGDELASLLSGR
jgi:DNA-binding beta-propeller fold protein YncE